MTIKEFFNTFNNTKNYIVSIEDVDKCYASWLIDTKEINDSNSDIWNDWKIEQWWIGTYYEHNDCFYIKAKEIS